MDRRLRVLYVCQHDFESPSEMQALALALELVRRGHAVAMSLGGDAGTARLHPHADIELFEHRFAWGRLRRADVRRASEWQPDLVHALNPRAPTVAAVRELAAATRAPVAVHFEDDEWRRHPGLPDEAWYRPGARVARRLASRARPSAWPESTGGSLRWVRRSAAGLDALTPALAGEVRRRLGRDCAVVLPVNPAELTASAPDPVDAELVLGDEPVALFTGTIWPVHLPDVALALRAVRELREHGHTIRFVHCGRVHPRIDVQELGNRCGLPSAGTRWLGHRSPAQTQALLKRATVLLQPGAPTEFNRLRLPAKLQSYLASGTPTITFATGFGELLEDRVEVLKTYTEEPTELAARIAELLDDAALRRTLSAGGPAAARRLFNPHLNIRSLLRHYRAVLAAN